MDVWAPSSGVLKNNLNKEGTIRMRVSLLHGSEKDTCNSAGMSLEFGFHRSGMEGVDSYVVDSLLFQTVGQGSCMENLKVPLENL